MWENGADRCPFICFDKGALCGSVTVRNVHRHQEHSTESPLFFLAEDCSIDRLMLDNVHQTTGEGATAPLWKIRGKIGTLIERDVMH